MESQFVYMDLNFSRSKLLPFNPRRFCRKKTGPSEVHLMATRYGQENRGKKQKGDGTAHGVDRFFHGQ